jgi:hypothetical protein
MDNLAYYDAKEHILIILSNYYSSTRASSKNCNPLYEAKASSLLNGKKKKKKKTDSLTSSQIGNQKCT